MTIKHTFTRGWRPCVVLAFVLAAATAAVLRAETIVLTDGDRITGKILSEGRKTFRRTDAIRAPADPRAQIERVVGKDGERVINAPASELPSPSSLIPADPAVQLVIGVTGKSFWHAWDPKASPPPETTLRFLVRLDEDTVATYADARLDPDLLPGVSVNAFSFEPPDITYVAGAGVRAPAPEIKPSRVLLKIDLPGEKAGTHQLRIAFTRRTRARRRSRPGRTSSGPPSRWSSRPTCR